MLLSNGVERRHRNLFFTFEPLSIPPHLQNPRTRKFSLAPHPPLPPITYPSLLELPPFSASFCISSLQIVGAPTATVMVYAPSLLYSTSIPRSPSTTSPSFAYSTPSPPAQLLALSSPLPSPPMATPSSPTKTVGSVPRGAPPRSGHHCIVASLPTVADRLRHLPLPSNYITVCRHKKLLWIQHTDDISVVVAAGDLLYSISYDKMLKMMSSMSLPLPPRHRLH